MPVTPAAVRRAVVNWDTRRASAAKTPASSVMFAANSQALWQRNADVERHAAREGHQSNQATDQRDRRGNCRELCERHVNARPRHRQQQVQGRRLLFAAKRPGRREERPDAEERQDHGEPPGRVAAGLSTSTGSANTRIGGLLHQHVDAGARLRVGEQCWHQRKDQRGHRADAHPPAEDRAPAVAQRFQEDATKPHGGGPPVRARRRGSSEGRSLRGSVPG